LTISSRRADIRAFWIVTTAVFSLAMGSAANILGASMPWAWGLAALALPLPGLSGRRGSLSASEGGTGAPSPERPSFTRMS